MGFNSLISQDRAIRILGGTIRKERIPSSMLFIGEPMIGKTTAAVEYAKALNCLRREHTECCDSCSSCKKIERGVHPDLRIIAPERDTITVENIRALEEFLVLSPLEGRYKVAVLRNVEKLNIFAANAMLKILEEPPPNRVIILTCENQDALPEALVSRTFRVYFCPLSREAIEKMIPQGLEPSERETVVKFSMGRPGFFLSLDILEKIRSFKETLTFKRQRRAPWKDNEEVKWWLDLFLILIRDIICFKILNEGSGLYFKMSQKFNDLTIDEIFACYSEILEIRRNIDLNLNKSILWNYLDRIVRRFINE